MTFPSIWHIISLQNEPKHQPIRPRTSRQNKSNRLPLLFVWWIGSYYFTFSFRSLVNVQKKIYQGQKVLQYFTTREWYFDTDNIVNLQQSMNSTDQEIFPVTMKDFKDRTAYMDNAIKVARHYILKEDPASIPQCKKKMRMWVSIDRNNTRK